MTLPNDMLRTLCIKNNWFTEGTNGQYEKLFLWNNLGGTLSDLALIIWVCTPDEDCGDILDKLQDLWDLLHEIKED